MKVISQIFFRNYHLVVIAAVQYLCMFGQRVHSTTIEQENNFQNLLEKMESDVLALRDEIERVYQYRCNLSTLRSCGYNNYNDCTSSYPNEACVSDDEFVISCGDGTACKGKDQCESEMKQTHDFISATPVEREIICQCDLLISVTHSLLFQQAGIQRPQR